MKWNQEIFNKNIEHLIAVKCGGIQNKFNEKMGRDAATRWKKSRPSIENLLAITEEYGCSLDWLLTENTGEEDKSNSFANNWDGELINDCKILEKVYNYPDLKRALKENLNAFSAAVDDRKENTEMKAVLSQVLSSQKELQDRVIALEAVHAPEQSKVIEVSKRERS